MANVLITGGTGFVGSWMAKTKPAGFEIYALNRHNYETEWWDMWDFDYIVHLANVSPDKVIEASRYNHVRVLYCSSGIVYHEENNTEYRQNKIKWEKACLDSGVDVVIARLFTFSGEGLDDNKAIVQFQKAAGAGQPLRVWGDGSCIRSYMHGSILGKWMWAILLKGKTGEAYDVGDDKPITMLELARRYSNNVIVEGGKDAMPVYLPPDTAKTKALLDE
jgi:nucleoside-diphosphate-sugar epimerase